MDERKEGQTPEAREFEVEVTKEYNDILQTADGKEARRKWDEFRKKYGITPQSFVEISAETLAANRIVGVRSTLPAIFETMKQPDYTMFVVKSPDGTTLLFQNPLYSKGVQTAFTEFYAECTRIEKPDHQGSDQIVEINSPAILEKMPDGKFKLSQKAKATMEVRMEKDRLSVYLYNQIIATGEPEKKDEMIKDFLKSFGCEKVDVSEEDLKFLNSLIAQGAKAEQFLLFESDDKIGRFLRAKYKIGENKITHIFPDFSWDTATILDKVEELKARGFDVVVEINSSLSQSRIKSVKPLNVGYQMREDQGYKERGVIYLEVPSEKNQR